jgi:hypothetical protein
MFLVIGLIGTGLYVVYLWIKCAGHLEKGKGWLLWTPLWMFISSVYDDLGNQYRIVALRFFIIYLILFCLLILVEIF